jgi:hypothetical protein
MIVVVVVIMVVTVMRVREEGAQRVICQTVALTSA